MKNSNPFFSIIIPVYNTQDELDRCMAGIFAETFQNYEVVLVDDGSTDNSGAICDAYAAENENVVCIHKQNGGAPEARNVGIKNASGTYLMFLDSDDTWTDPKALEDIHDIIVSRANPDLVCFGVEIVDDNGNLEKIRIPVKPENRFINRWDLLKHLIYTNQYFSAAYVKVIRRKLIEEKKLYFVTSYLSGEDIEWSGRILLHCETIEIYESSFYRRIRRVSGAITSSIGKKNILDILDGIKTGVSYIDKWEKDKDYRAIYYEYWAYQYAMLFVLMGQLAKENDYDQLILEMKKYQWLLKYNHHKKVRIVKMIVTLFGLKNSMRILTAYYSSK